MSQTTPERSDSDPIDDNEPLTKSQARSMFASVLEESFQIDATPHENYIERHWSGDHTTKMLDNMATDQREYRQHESNKLVFGFLLIIAVLIVVTLLIAFGKGQEVKDIGPNIISIVAVAIGSWYASKNKHSGG